MGQVRLVSYPRVHVPAPRNDCSCMGSGPVELAGSRQGRKVGMPAHKTQSEPVSSSRVGGMNVELENECAGRFAKA